MSVKPFGYMARVTIARLLSGEDEVGIAVKPTPTRDAPIYDQSVIDQLTAEIARLKALLSDSNQIPM
jgi:hypothetical protein